MTYGQQPGRGPAGPGGVPGPGAPVRGPVPAMQGPPPGHAANGYRHGAHPYGGGPSPYGAAVPHGAPPAPPAPSYPYGPPQPYGTGRSYDALPGYGPPGYAPPAGRRRRAPMAAAGPVTDEDERWAVPAYVGMFVSGFVAPAIVYFAKGRSSSFARFHAVQALNLWIAMTVCNLVVYGLMYVIGFTGLFVALAVVSAEFFCIVKAAIGANRREWYRLPAIAAWPILR